MARAKTQMVLDSQTPGCDAPLVTEALDTDGAADTSKIFKALSDPVRLRLFSLIAARAGGEVCVCDLNVGFDVTAPTISFHLRALRESGLVTGERRASWVYYRVNRDMLQRLTGFFSVPMLAGDQRGLFPESVQPVA